MSCPRRTQQCSGSSGGWSYSWSSGPNGTVLNTTGNVPDHILQQLKAQMGGNVTVCGQQQTADSSDSDSDSGAAESAQQQPEATESGSSQWGWRQAALDKHNKYRQRHGAPPMVLDQALVNMAQKTADYLAGQRMMAHVSKNVFGHSYGENLATTYIEDKEKACVDATERWYNEVSHYRYNSPGFSMHTGHFTQVVWKESTKLGIGYARNGNFMIVVGQYSPHGNMQGDFGRNVSPPQ